MNDRTERARSALENLKGFWPAIAARAEVSHSWLCQFAWGKIPHPTTRTLDSLIRVLREIEDGAWRPSKKVTTFVPTGSRGD